MRTTLVRDLGNYNIWKGRHQGLPYQTNPRGIPVEFNLNVSFQFFNLCKFVFFFCKPQAKSRNQLNKLICQPFILSLFKRMP
jgi:hypothetical protein